MSNVKKIAVATTMAATILASSMTGAQAGKKSTRNIALGVGAAILGAAILSHRAKSQPRYYKKRYNRRHCWTEHRERWSNYYGGWVVKKVRVCN